MTFATTLRTRPLFVVVFVATLVNFLASWYIGVAKSHFGVLVPDAAHTYPIRYRGGVSYFFQPALGTYLDWSFAAHFVALGVLFLLSWYYTRRERAAV